MEKKFNVTGNYFPDKHYMADVSQKMADTLKGSNGHFCDELWFILLYVRLSLFGQSVV